MRRVLCSLQRATTHPGQARQWKTQATIWVELKTLRATQSLRAGQEEVTITHIAYLRYRNDIEIGDRLLHDQIAYDIIQLADPDMRKKRLIGKCLSRQITTPITQTP